MTINLSCIFILHSSHHLCLMSTCFIWKWKKVLCQNILLNFWHPKQCFIVFASFEHCDSCTTHCRFCLKHWQKFNISFVYSKTTTDCIKILKPKMPNDTTFFYFDCICFVHSQVSFIFLNTSVSMKCSQIYSIIYSQFPEQMSYGIHMYMLSTHNNAWTHVPHIVMKILPPNP